jgi:cytosine deaminase
LLRHVTLPDGTVADVALEGGLVVGVSPPGTAAALGEVLELGGFILLPSLVEPHAHLDKAFTADAVINPEGSLMGAITAWLPARVGFSRADIAARAWAVTRQYLLHGTTAIRAHIDTGEGIGLRAIEALLAVPSRLETEAERLHPWRRGGRSG